MRPGWWINLGSIVDAAE